MKPHDGFEIEDESDINAMDFDDDLDENLLESNYDFVSQHRLHHDVKFPTLQ